MLLASTPQVESRNLIEAVRIGQISKLNASTRWNFAAKVSGALGRSRCCILSHGFSTGNLDSQKWYFDTIYRSSKAPPKYVTVTQQQSGSASLWRAEGPCTSAQACMQDEVRWRGVMPWFGVTSGVFLSEKLELQFSSMW